MFHKTGSAMTKPHARDQDGCLYDDRIQLEGVNEDDMKKIRLALFEEPMPMTYDNTADMLYKTVHAKTLKRWCIDYGLLTTKEVGVTHKAS